MAEQEAEERRQREEARRLEEDSRLGQELEEAREAARRRATSSAQPATSRSETAPQLSRKQRRKQEQAARRAEQNRAGQRAEQERARQRAEQESAAQRAEQEHAARRDEQRPASAEPIQELADNPSPVRMRRWGKHAGSPSEAGLSSPDRALSAAQEIEFPEKSIRAQIDAIDMETGEICSRHNVPAPGSNLLTELHNAHAGTMEATSYTGPAVPDRGGRFLRIALDDESSVAASSEAQERDPLQAWYGDNHSSYTAVFAIKESGDEAREPWVTPTREQTLEDITEHVRLHELDGKAAAALKEAMPVLARETMRIGIREGINNPSAYTTRIVRRLAREASSQELDEAALEELEREAAEASSGSEEEEQCEDDEERRPDHGETGVKDEKLEPHDETCRAHGESLEEKQRGVERSVDAQKAARRTAAAARKTTMADTALLNEFEDDGASEGQHLLGGVARGSDSAEEEDCSEADEAVEAEDSESGPGAIDYEDDVGVRSDSGCDDAGGDRVLDHLGGSEGPSDSSDGASYGTDSDC